jgi:hypothetical protein
LFGAFLLSWIPVLLLTVVLASINIVSKENKNKNKKKQKVFKNSTC